MEKPKAESSNYNPMKLDKNLEGFSQQKGLIVGTRVDHETLNR